MFNKQHYQKYFGVNNYNITHVIHIAPKIKLKEMVDISELDISFKRWNGELVNFYEHQHLLTFQFE